MSAIAIMPSVWSPEEGHKQRFPNVLDFSPLVPAKTQSVRGLANFIDAGHLMSLAHDMGVESVDVAALIAKMAGDHTIVQSFYYDCLPPIVHDSTPRQRHFFHQQHRRMTAIKHIPRMCLRLGKLRHREEPNGRSSYQQKQVDTSIAVDMTDLAVQGLIGHVAIFANDEDFVPVIRRARKAGVHVHLFFGRRARKELLRLCNTVTNVTDEFIRSVARVPRSTQVPSAVA